MKNKKGILITLIVFSVFMCLLYLKMKPPLYSFGYSMNKTLHPNVIVVEVNNDGFTNIHLKDVVVNESENPQKVELGISRSNMLVNISELSESTEGTSFHKLSDFPITPSPENNFELGDSETIRHYGVAIYHDRDIKSVTVKYSYLGIPFSKKIEID